MVLAAVSLGAMQASVNGVGFRGQESRLEHRGALGDAVRGGRAPPAFRFEVLGAAPSGDRHPLRFRARNEGDAAVEKLAAEGRLAAEVASLTLDYLAAGEEREAAFLSAADPSRHPVSLVAASFAGP
jgi:uncharacterized protein (TIGR02588 family)